MSYPKNITHVVVDTFAGRVVSRHKSYEAALAATTDYPNPVAIAEVVEGGEGVKVGVNLFVGAGYLARCELTTW